MNRVLSVLLSLGSLIFFGQIEIEQLRSVTLHKGIGKTFSLV